MVGPHTDRKLNPFLLSEAGKRAKLGLGCGKLNKVNRDQKRYDKRLGLWVSSSPTKGSATTAGQSAARRMREMLMLLQIPGPGIYSDIPSSVTG